MTVALIIQGRDVQPLRSGLSDVLKDVEIQVWPQLTNLDAIEFVVAWNCPENLLSQLPNLKAICSLGAGVDGILALKDLPQVPVCRIVEENLSKQMCDYVLAQILNFQYQFTTYNQQQSQSRWQERKATTVKSVALLGVGQLGHQVANDLLNRGFQISGWSNSPKPDRAYPCFHGDDGLTQVVSNADCVVSLLPATQHTDDLFNLRFFQQMQSHALFINVGRGNSVVEMDLLYALQHKVIHSACLDVFKTEPLPQQHPFWQQSNLVITPHIAAVTKQQNIIEQIASHYVNLQSGQRLSYIVDRNKGY
ncbi:glyoxylate/hydroxypyruvate reductase A [Thalassotalea litorea]|uniref:Glyoxylate/hydroxypyruvate reductase A n=1 Tax=Thalassotalea litorea TaxID=2020715 RepID=A0A5R9IF91_9GAMM|nr:glyoxylate/hydroxypyruvate reductase A [Thalassotalea litorea]TLU64190.1 glyoxylate/hydroxypyruvate reductase A [Thalassotalea litorea]